MMHLGLRSQIIARMGRMRYRGLLASFCALLVLGFGASPAQAVDFAKALVDENGKPVCTLTPKELDGRECPVDSMFTLRLAARNALNGVYQDEQNLSGDEKYKRGEIAQSIIATGEVKLKVEDIALIKRLIGKAYPPPIVFQAWRELDPPK